MNNDNTIYFDNSATTIHKPTCVKDALNYAIDNLGNAGRSFYDYSTDASRQIYLTRVELAKLINENDPLNIAFTSSATESLNLVIYGLFDKNDHVITTKCEHNSVLRPLYNSDADISFLDLDDKGRILTEGLPKLLKQNTKGIVCTHGSNLTGNMTPVKEIRDFCMRNDLILVLDAAQTMGTIEVNNDMADFICFTGHKGLLGPQGTGGVSFSGKDLDKFDLKIIKTGGTGSNSYDMLQPYLMPDVFEAGTPNAHGLYGLKESCRYINNLTVREIHRRESEITRMFIDGIKNHKGIKIYGDINIEDKLPVVSINFKGLTSENLALRLWSEYSIATRAGVHCAPLLHEHFGTKKMGMVRFSFSHMNTEDEVTKAVEALERITWNIS